MAKIIKIKDNIVTIKGTEKFKIFDYYKLAKDVEGIILSAKDKEATLVSIGDSSKIKINSTVKSAKKEKYIEVKDSYFGKIIGIDGEIIYPNIKEEKGKVLGKSSLFNNSPLFIERTPVCRPLESGMLAIDTMIPIGKGQRELIIGDRNTGKSYIGINTIINNKKDVKSIYIAIGQKRTSVINTYNILKRHNALKNTIILYANTDSPAKQMLSPMVGAAMAESLAYQGEDVLLVIDDLTKHANVYREISLSMERNPGREAYPNDIFYVHSRLLERGGQFGKKYKNGSIAILPIVETVEGDIASLIPSNIISITDGQIFTSAEKFNKGEFPAVDIQLSVSRTGSAVQNPLVVEASKGLKAEHAVYEEIKKFASMSVDMTDELSSILAKSGQFDKIILQFGNLGYSKEEIAIIVNLYRANLLTEKVKIRELQIFINGFVNKSPIGKKMKQIIKENNDNPEKLQEYISEALNPYIKASIGDYSLVSKLEYEWLKGGA